MTVAFFTTSSEELSEVEDAVSEEESEEDGGVLGVAVQLAKVSKADKERMSNAGFFMLFLSFSSRGYLV